MTPYSPERPCGRLVKTATGHKVEWLSKADDEQPIPFQKKDDTAISGKKQVKNSLKRAKKQRKDRLKAEAAAEAARAKLSKVEIDMKDPIIEIAKAVVAGGKARITKKRDFYRGIVKLAAERYPEECRPAVRFSKYVTNDDTGRLLLAAMRKADGDEPTTWDGEEPDTGDAMPDTSSAYDEMAARARKLARKEGITFAVAFSRITRDRPDLMALDKQAHFAKIARAMSDGR